MNWRIKTHPLMSAADSKEEGGLAFLEFQAHKRQV